ncbi:MAG TPA: cytochrome c3 family protein [Tepidisphaeraceae bacterium]|nr:cytochrome c3 family protein [Tepidisphaeraceae bacterium]
MAQIFHPRMNTLAKASIIGGVLFAAALGALGAVVDRSPYMTNQGVIRNQPIPFSHAHHVKGLGIDCRYCHTSVEHSGSAGFPSTKTCMTCHSQVYRDSDMLKPVRDSWEQNKPIVWNRVHNLADYVYFDHSIHVAKGVGCNTCHGPVDEMRLMWQHSTLQMDWCLSCHRKPEEFIRPKDEIYNMHYDPKAEAASRGTTVPEMQADLLKQYHIRAGQLTNCSICHR